MTAIVLREIKICGSTGVILALGMSACVDSRPAVGLTPQVMVVQANGCGPVARLAVGFALDETRVMTVAHALRGAKVVTADGEEARVVYLDHRADIAVLSIASRLDLPRTTFALPQKGPAGLLRPATVSAALESVAPESTAASSGKMTDIGISSVAAISIEEPADSATHKRAGLVGRISVGKIAVGDSGSPVVDATGAVVGMVFANDEATERTLFAVSGSELETASLEARASTVSTGKCDD